VAERRSFRDKKRSLFAATRWRVFTDNPYFGKFIFSVAPKLPPLTLRRRVDLQSPRKIVPKGRPLEVLQSAENKWSNLICGAVPQSVGCETKDILTKQPPAARWQASVLCHFQRSFPGERRVIVSTTSTEYWTKL
jgi:hypothetical protein